MKLCAVIGDIVSSRKIKERNKFQKLFQQILDDVNTKYNAGIASNFTITLGDEFQGLLRDFYLCYEIIEYIEDKLSPYTLMAGVGIGDMNTEYKKEIAIGSDGPAYNYAREMLEKAKKASKSSILHEPHILFYSGSSVDDLVNSLYYFIESCRDSRTERQTEVIRTVESLRDKSQREAARILNVEQSTVSRILNSAFYFETVKARESIRKFLMSFQETNTP